MRACAIALADAARVKGRNSNSPLSSPGFFASTCTDTPHTHTYTEYTLGIERIYYAAQPCIIQ